MLSHVEDWNRLTERIGFWIDLDDAYRTLDTDYIESVWWALKTIYDKGLLYERLKVVPYCPRDGTTLSSHELGQPDVYQDVIDPSVYVRLPVARGPRRGRAGDELLVWTTTPWTLVSNAAVAVDPELTYVRARADDGAVFILAEALVERVLGAAPRSSRASPARSSSASATSRRSTSSPAAPTASGPHACCSATSSPPRTAPASCTRRSPSARTTSASASSTA